MSTFTNIKDSGALVSKIAGGYLKNNLKFINNVSKEPESSFTNVNGYGSGNTIDINIPAILTSQSDNLNISSFDSGFTETTVPIALNKTESMAIPATSLELQTDISEAEFIRRNGRVIESAVIGLASQIESRCLLEASNAVYNITGNAGSTVFNQATILHAKDQMARGLVPMDDNKCVLLNSSAMSSASASRVGFYNPSSDISKIYGSGYVGTADGFKYTENELLPTHVNGTDTTFEVSITVNTEGASTLVVEGLTATTGTVTKGTVFTVADVYSVNPQTKASTGYLQKFVVTADATANGSGIATLSVSPAMYTSASGGQQNITAFPQDGAQCTVGTGAANGSHVQNLAFHRDAFRFISPKMYRPTSQEMAGSYTMDGVTVNTVLGYDNNLRQLTLRLDVLFGFASVRPEWACRITS